MAIFNQPQPTRILFRELSRAVTFSEKKLSQRPKTKEQHFFLISPRRDVHYIYAREPENRDTHISHERVRNHQALMGLSPGFVGGCAARSRVLYY